MPVTLYRPVGLKEMELILRSGSRGFPPRLPWQPIFYPVLNARYATEIAEKWNTPDEFSGYCGFVTAFDLPDEYLQSFEVQSVGGAHHEELWVPAEELETFNGHLLGPVRIESAWYGPAYEGAVHDTPFFAGKNALAQMELLSRTDAATRAAWLPQERIALALNHRFWQQRGMEPALLGEIAAVLVGS